MFKRILLIGIVFLSAVTSCRKDRINAIPLVTVDVTINLNNPQFIDLTYVSGWEYLTGGSMGLIVYRNSETEFSAFDRHSTYEPEEDCRVSVGEDNITIEDECSDSSWLLIDGSVITGPAAAPLQRYNTSYNPPYLRIYN